MDIRHKKIVPDLRLFEAIRVSRDAGRRRLQKLAKEGRICPEMTPTGRCLMSIAEAEKLASEF